MIIVLSCLSAILLNHHQRIANLIIGLSSFFVDSNLVSVAELKSIDILNFLSHLDFLIKIRVDFQEIYILKYTDVKVTRR